MSKLYLYLGRRDKKGVQVLTVLNGDAMPPARVADLGILQLPHEVKAELDSLIYGNRMEWEPWLQSANSYQELKESLQKRGYSNLPVHSMPLAQSTNLYKPHKADTSKIPAKQIMVQKPSRPR